MVVKKSFVLYDEYRQYFAQLSMEERGRLITALFEYNSDRTEPTDLSPISFMAFSFMKDQLDRDREKYMKRAERSRTNGALGGRPKKPSGLFEKPRKPDTETETETDTDIDTYTYTETEIETDTYAAWDDGDEDRSRDDGLFNFVLKKEMSPEIAKYFKAATSK